MSLTLKEPMLCASLLDAKTEHSDENIFAAMKKLRYPVLATLKKDGIRALRLNGTLLSRRLKKVPNKSIRERSLILAGGSDMELWNKSLPYHDIESIVMSHEHPRSGEIEFHLLDWFGIADYYVTRVHKIMEVMPNFPPELKVRFSPPVECINAEQFFAFFKGVEDMAGEGICFRTPLSPYKQGRSTLKEQWLVKLARFSYEDYKIVGFVEQFENCNPEQYGNTGKMERSQCNYAMIGKNTLGSFQVVNKNNDMEFSVGTGVGLTDVLRKYIWENKDNYIGKYIRVKCKRHGEKIKPRSPVFVGFRNEIDL